MPARNDPVARNEVLFRNVNERVADVNREGDEGGVVDFICECGDSSCVESIALTLVEYESVRSEPTHFALRPGHEGKGVESVVARNERFVTVEKHLSESAVARASDPRR